MRSTSTFRCRYPRQHDSAENPLIQTGLAVQTSGASSLCVSSIQDSDLCDRLVQASPTLDTAETVYHQHGCAATLNEIAPSVGVGQYVSTEEMVRVYENTFVGSKRTRHIYDALKKQPKNDICPLCGQRTTSSLDHFLPKTDFPVYGITPANLVPSCFECNHSKRATHGADATDLTLHPYFDDVDDAQWLFARVIETKPPALRFYVDPPQMWDGTKQLRVHKHFDTFALGNLYASHSGEELSNILPRLRRMAGSISPGGIRAHLQEVANDCAQHHLNSWRRATYDALAQSDWFCEGGFNHV